jgi:hypothetical protein
MQTKLLFNMIRKAMVRAMVEKMMENKSEQSRTNKRHLQERDEK